MRPPRRPAVLRGCVFRSRDVLADGVLTPSALRSSAWRRLYRGIYVDSSLPDGIDLRVRGASLLAPAAAVSTGRTAAFLHGATELAGLRAPLESTVPAGTSFGPVTGRRTRHRDVDPADITTIAGRRCTTELAGSPCGTSGAASWPGWIPRCRTPWHGEAPQLTKDRRRMNALTSAGWKVLYVTAADMRDPVALVRKVRAFLASTTLGKSSIWTDV